MVASALSLVVRYRRSGGEEREQIKWIAFAAWVVGMLYLITMVSSLFFPLGWGAAGTPLWLGLLQHAALVRFTAVPIAVGFAVLKYRLYDIDLLINRALVYGSLTAMLVLVYVGGMISLQYAFRTLTGQGSQLAIVASTLMIAALFNPLRRRVQAFVDRRFYRSKYDARKTLKRCAMILTHWRFRSSTPPHRKALHLQFTHTTDTPASGSTALTTAIEAFSSKLRDQTDLKALDDDLLGVVAETMQPAHVSLWLRPDTAPQRHQAG
jgi:hypothetical protein